MNNIKTLFAIFITNQLDLLRHKKNFEKSYLEFKTDEIENAKDSSNLLVKLFNKISQNKNLKSLLSRLPSYDPTSRKNRLIKNYERKKINYEKQILRLNKVLSNLIDNNEHTIEKDSILSLQNVSINFGGLKALDNLSFDVKKGEIFGLIGPNGAGKTTLFNCITQFYKATEGKIIFNSSNNGTINLNDYSVHNIINRGIVRTFQNLELIYDLSITENLLIAAHRQFSSNLIDHMFSLPKLKTEEKILRRKAEKILKDLDLYNLKDYPPVGLPYGTLKRIELARTLMADSELIILDEPAAGLNEEETVELEKLIKNIGKKYKTTIFLVEHDMGLVMNVCDHICAISFGKKIAYGTPSQIQSNKDVQIAYLGTEVD